MTNRERIIPLLRMALGIQVKSTGHAAVDSAQFHDLIMSIAEYLQNLPPDEKAQLKISIRYIMNS